MATETQTIEVVNPKTGDKYDLQAPIDATDDEIQAEVNRFEASLKSSPEGEGQADGPTLGNMQDAMNKALPKNLRSMVGELTPLPDPTAPAYDPLSGSRGAAIMTGATAGAFAGAPAGPAGILGGGILGAMAGSYGSDALVDAQKNLLNVGALQDYRIPSLDEREQRAKTEALYEAGFGAAGQSLGPLVRGAGNAFLDFGLGVGRKEKDIAREAAAQGVKLGIPEISRYGLVQESANILGRFPIIGESFKMAQAARKGAIDRVSDSLFTRVGPIVSTAKQGINMMAAGKKSFKQFRDRANTLYDIALNLADKNKAKFDASEIVALARSTKANKLAAQPTRYGFKDIEIPGSPIASLSSVKSPAFGPTKKRALTLKRSVKGQQEAAKDFMELVSDMGKLDKSQNIRQLDELAGRLDSVINAGKKDRDSSFMNEALALKEAIEVAMRTTGDVEVGKAFKAADNYFTTNMKKTFETATAKRFERVDKKSFKVGFAEPGSLEADELYKALISTDSPMRIRNLRRILGPEKSIELFKAAQRTKIDEALADGMRNIGKDGFDKNAFFKKLGVSNPSSSEAQTTLELFKGGFKDTAKATREVMRGSKANLTDIKKFGELAERALQQGVPDVSTFIARRATLGGFKSVLKAFVPLAGASAFSGVSPGLIFVGYYLTRRGADALANPRIFKSLQQVMRYENQPKLKAAAMLRAIQLTPESVAGKQQQYEDMSAPAPEENPVRPPIR